VIVVHAAQGLAHLLPFSRRELAAALEKMLEALGLEDFDLELALLDEGSMASLNKDFLGCAGPTNVLSFPARDMDPVEQGDGASEAVLGQLALAPWTVRREAFLYGQELERHTLWLLAHGVTHLAGHEHGPMMDALAETALNAALLAEV